MEIIKLETGEFELRDGERTLYFSILSDSLIRVHEADVPASCCVTNITPIDQGILQETVDGVALFGYGKLRVSFRPGLLLGVTYDAVACLHELKFKTESAKFDYSLAVKEGHEVFTAAPRHGGLCFENKEPVYGLGDKTGPLDKRGYSFENYCTDAAFAHTDNTPRLYKAINFFTMLRGSKCVGVFLDNTYATSFDFNKGAKPEVTLSYSNGKLDVYYFFGTLSEVTRQFNGLTGRNSLVPRWALGAQQSRWSYGDKAQVEDVIKGYKDNGIPLSAVYLDIDYMSNYKDFTIDEGDFPYFSNWVKSLSELGVHIVPIIDCGVKAEPGYFLYDEGIENGYFAKKDGEVYHNEVWPGDSVFPAFLDEKVRTWWSYHVSEFLKTGIGGIWNDMNEPASFKGPLPPDVDMGGKPHEEAHNIYAHYESKATFDGFLQAKKRPFIITRAAYAGTSRYTTTWTGDNQSSFDHLKMSIAQLANLSLSGMAYIGTDIGGFGGDCTKELLCRYVNASILTPLFRNHSAIGCARQEPYAFDQETIEVYRQAVLTRYELIPAIYDALFMHETTGSAVLRPLVYNYQTDENTHQESTEIMLGRSLLLAPSFCAGQNVRAVYFPDVFYSFQTGRRYEKGYHLIQTSIHDIPLFVRQKSLIPLNPVGTKTTDFPSTLRLLWTGEDASLIHYEDAGDGLGYKNGEYNLFRIHVSKEGGTEITYLHEGIPTHYRSIQVDMVGGGSITRPF